jgi:DNA-directed RNA polymerase subunit RPC12/RpoP
MIEFYCPDCKQLFRARDESAGNTVWCARCSKRVPVPQTGIQAAPLELVPIDPQVEPASNPFPFSDSSSSGAGGPRFDPSMTEEARGPYATCPHCGSPGGADRVTFTWWGGLLGPALFNHVRCRRCQNCYNGRTGQPNTTAIAVYLGSGFGLAFLILIFAACMGIATIR